MRESMKQWYKNHELWVTVTLLIVAGVLAVVMLFDLVPDVVRDVRRTRPESRILFVLLVGTLLLWVCHLMRTMGTSPGRCSIGLAIIASAAYVAIFSAASDVLSLFGVFVAILLAFSLAELGRRRSAREMAELREQVCELTKRVERAEERSGQG